MTCSGFDFVNLIDPISGDVIGQLSGGLADLDRTSFQSEGPAMDVRFISDGSINGDGFTGTYSCGESHVDRSCNDRFNQLAGHGSCDKYLQSGQRTCAQNFCSSCNFHGMC
eukprot:SAG31_NODE_34382_length_333_cov_1.226496_1_plen_110_part_11